MSYATQQDLIDRFGEAELLQLTDPEQTGSLDSARIQVSLDDADREINAYLGARYPLPLTATPPLLITLACDIARYKIYTHAPPEEVSERYRRARSLLLDIAARRADLEGVTLPADANRGISVQAPAVIFTNDVLDKMP